MLQDLKPQSQTNIRKWLIIFTSSFAESPRLAISSLVDQILAQKLSILIITYRLYQSDEDLCTEFVAQFHDEAGVEVAMEKDPSPDRVRVILEGLANFKMNTGEPLIMETFS